MQVLWLGKPEIEVKWVPATSLPKSLIDEYGDGIRTEGVQHCTDAYGQRTYTLETTCSPQYSGTASKKPRRERPVVEETKGWV